MARDFDIPLGNHRAIFGAFLAAHAIPDALDLMFTGVGCKPKSQRQLAVHDRFRDAGNKLAWADVGDVQLISGPAERLRNTTVETVRRRGNVGLVLVTTSAAMELTGADVEAVLPAIRRDVDCPVVHLPAAGWDGDLYRGYASAVRAVLGLVPWKAPRGDRRVVNLLGYLFDRYENDHRANLAELRRLLGVLGITVNVGFLSGAPFAELMRAPAAGTNLLLPYLPGEPASFRAATRRSSARCALPVGLGATTRFLEEGARAAGVPRRTVQALVAAERERLEPLLRIAREGLAGMRAAVLADTPLAAGLVALLGELGVKPVLAGLLDRTLGGAEAFRSALAAAGGAEDDCVVLPDPTADEVEAACVRLRGGRRGAGSSPPFELLIAPDLWLPPAAVDGVARVELGFPSNRRHAIAASPFMGFAGVVSLAQRLLDAVASPNA